MNLRSQIFYSTIRDSINWNLPQKKKGGNNLLDYIYVSFEGVKNLVLVVFIITSHPKKREYKKEWKKENLWSFKRTIMDKLTLTLWVWSWWHQIPVIFFQNSLKPTFSSFSLYEKFRSASTLNALPLLAYSSHRLCFHKEQWVYFHTPYNHHKIKSQSNIIASNTRKTTWDNQD